MNRYRLTLFLAAMLILSIACSLPGLTGSRSGVAVSPTVPPPPTATPRADLPPALIETDPPLGSEISPAQGITFYFNQPMQRTSVEAALRAENNIAGRFEWRDDATVTFYPQAPFTPESDLRLLLDTGAQAQNGKGLARPVPIRFRVAGPLRVTQRIPAPDSHDVSAYTAIVTAFNRPVVPLGADPASLPAAFTLDPPAQGRGEWLNTSTYIFYPQPGLLGGTTYRATLNPNLQSAAGTPLDNADSWSFHTTLPKVIAVQPDRQELLPLDAPITIQFNQPMDPASVEAALSISTAPALNTSWDDTFSTLTLTPARPLQYGTRYTLTIDAAARSAGGTTLEGAYTTDWTTYPHLAATGLASSRIEVYESLSINLTAPLPKDLANDRLADYIHITPEVDSMNFWWYPDGRQIVLYINGSFSAMTEYTITLSPNLPDAWGGTLGAPASFTFQTEALPPTLYLTSPMFWSSVFLSTPSDEGVIVAAASLETIKMQVSPMPLKDLLALTASQGSLRDYHPPRLSVSEVRLDAPQDRVVQRVLPLPDNQPGIYYLNLNTYSNTARNNFQQDPFILIVSNVNLTFKRGAHDALVWAARIADGQPVAGAPVSIYDSGGALIAQGQTDAQGIFYAQNLPDDSAPTSYAPALAVLSKPGDERFSLAQSNMNQELPNGAPQLSPTRTRVYVYSDRPIYRPGQTMHFNVILRQTFDGRYTLSSETTVEAAVFDAENNERAHLTLNLNAYGTASGEYTLPEEAVPGEYRLEILTPAQEYPSGYLFFTVAAYRKPEFEFEIHVPASDMLAGETLSAQVAARYYFGAPAGDLPVHWTLSQYPDYFSLPGYTAGPEGISWFEWYPFMGFDGGGITVAEGDARTDAQGLLSIETGLPASEDIQRYVLEVTGNDESGYPISGRVEIRTHPERFYIGVRAEQWVAPAGSERTFEARTVDWERNPSGGQAVSVSFERVIWKQHPAIASYGLSTYEKVVTPLAQTQVTTDEGGTVRLSFTPDRSGIYQITLRGGNTLTEMLFWVGGADSGTWPAVPNQKLVLTPDREIYQPGDTAQVFVPNPFGVDTQVLVTLERSTIHHYEIQTLPAGGGALSLPLGEAEAPNVYATVTLLGQRADGHPDFRYGMVNLPVTPHRLTLQVSLPDLPAQAGTRHQIQVHLRVTDADGSPVQGIFSLAMVDKAVLALADPNSQPIEDAFYGQQPLEIVTGIGLAAYVLRGVESPGGLGGGGGGELVTPVRQEFPDTAYWQADITTDANGEATVSIETPDSLTTWVLDVRGITLDSRVGSAQAELVVTKPLLLRPVTPRFVILGDHFPLAAIVHNNTGEALQVAVQLQAPAFTLDDPASMVQTVSLQAGEHRRVDWWGTVNQAERLEVVFSAEGGRWSDATKPVWGNLPIMAYSAPQTYGTAGVLTEAGDILEVVSLPRNALPSGGTLEVELAPSLAATMRDGLDALEHYPYECNEQTLSRFLPNLAAYRVMQTFGLSAPDLESRLQRTLNDGLNRLAQTQNEDGGWGWWPRDESDPYITAYILFGLLQVRNASIEIPINLERVVNYLSATIFPLSDAAKDDVLDRQAMVLFALHRAGQDFDISLNALYERRARLSPTAQALLALTYPANSAETDILLSDLQGTAIRSASGTHWEVSNAYRRNLVTDVQSTAAVVYALAQRQPASTLLPDAVRYLMAARGPQGWASTYETSWSLLALSAVMQGTGELAGDFDFAATLNGSPLAAGNAAGDAQVVPVRSVVPLSQLYADTPNALIFSHAPGQGRLYYRAYLNVLLPVSALPPLAQGMNVARAYYLPGQVHPENALHNAQSGQIVEVHLTLSLPQEVHYLAIEDYLPAGAEVLNASLKTNPQEALSPENSFTPFVDGWMWWLFSPPMVYDDHIAWTADYLPAGTYELTYRLTLNQPGEYRVRPAHAYAFYLPEVQGRSAGEVFTIESAP
ncbi:MAG: hypothetical protein Fur0018_26920 [Anaerolineales bacterium]